MKICFIFQFLTSTTLFNNFYPCSLVSLAVSPPLTGDFGTLPGPVLTTIVASDPDELDSAYGTGGYLVRVGGPG